MGGGRAVQLWTLWVGAMGRLLCSGWEVGPARPPGEHRDGEQAGFPRNCFASRFWQPPDRNRPDEAFGVKTERGLDPAGSSHLLSSSPLPPGKGGFFCEMTPCKLPDVVRKCAGGGGIKIKGV